MNISSGRVNLALPLEIIIQIERECDKRGITRAQFIKEAIHERLKNMEERHDESEIRLLREEIHELKKIVLLTVQK
jgi:predicted DNA-binding protein